MKKNSCEIIANIFDKGWFVSGAIWLIATITTIVFSCLDYDKTYPVLLISAWIVTICFFQFFFVDFLALAVVIKAEEREEEDVLRKNLLQLLILSIGVIIISSVVILLVFALIAGFNFSSWTWKEYGITFLSLLLVNALIVILYRCILNYV